MAFGAGRGRGSNVASILDGLNQRAIDAPEVMPTVEREPNQRSPTRPLRFKDYIYSASARERISDKEALSRFVELIPWSLRSKSYGLLPAPKGFQPRSEAGLRQKEREFVRALTRPAISTANGDKKIWNIFGVIWQTYAFDICGNDFSSLTTLDGAAAATPDFHTARAYTKELIALLGRDRACVEVVERLFWGSPFPSYPEWQSEIGSLPTEAELTVRLERERMLERLRRDVDELERVTKENGAGLAELRRAEATSAEKLQTFTGDLAKRATRDVEWDRRLNQLSGNFSSLTDGVTALGAMFEEATIATREEARALAQLTERAEKFDDTLSSLSKRVDEVETLLLSSLDDLRAELRSSSGRQSSPEVHGPNGADVEPELLSRTNNSSLPSVQLIEDSEALFSALINTFGPRGADIEHLSRLDIAVRSRELPVLIGPHAREVVEAWLLAATAGEPEVVWTDPTLLSLSELVPSGPRGSRAPLSRAFTRARAEPNRCVVVLFDDFDSAAAGFWLADLARAIRQPGRYGFPENLLCLAIYEGEPGQVRLPRQRAGDLFPLCIQKLSRPRSPDSAQQPTPRTAISRALVAPPRSSSRWQDRVEAFRAIAASLIPDDKLDQWVDAFANHLRHMKDGAPIPTNGGTLADTLQVASSLISVEPEDKTNA